MKGFLLLILTFLTLWTVSCSTEDKLNADKQIQFAFTPTQAGGAMGGRTSATSEPQSVMVTLVDNAGNTVVGRKVLTLYKFGDNFLSSPLTLSASSLSNYRLSEFFVLDSDNAITHVTPKEGSAMAHLVSDPLDIEFAVTVGKITTITPEVIALNENAEAGDYGYGQFGFKVVKSINAVFSAFIKGELNFELATAHFKIEGLKDSISTDTTALWVYETDLEAKANTISLKEASFYRITATKSGYQTWRRSLPLQEDSKIEILFEKTEPSANVYVAGFADGKAAYWLNGALVPLSSKSSVAHSIFVSNGDIFVAGNISDEHRAMYWKNSLPVYLTEASQLASASAIAVSGNDVYVTGGISSGVNNNVSMPICWKNGIALQLISQIPNVVSGYAESIAIVGNDVYVSGTMIESVKGNQIATYWKNGIEFQLEQLQDSETRSIARSIRISGNDVFVSGAVFNNNGVSFAAYWKNGKLIKLPYSSSMAFDLSLKGENVILAGFGSAGSDVFYSWGKCWENGQEIALKTPEYIDILYSTVALDGNIYVAGTSIDAPNTNYSNHLAAYWVNGERVLLGTSQFKFSYALSIFVENK